MITFIKGKPEKNLYRRFKIRSVKKPNDIAMIKEILKKRIKHKEWGTPDLILIDGGKPQLSAVKSITRIPAVALAKRKNKLYFWNEKKPLFLKSLPSEISGLFLQLRDEAHRFAKKYHRKLREIDLNLKI